ncbi:unnamed protein product [Paramecium pentaurelia]|uniref:Uncharacterized protein n=1 Tax=Paramecium pentaurelia TaxID=43138 RepID=A0A8S1T2E6_9CILI|nr:unnamed protein product [Paramecium pentaurelia]
MMTMKLSIFQFDKFQECIYFNQQKIENSKKELLLDHKFQLIYFKFIILNGLENMKKILKTQENGQLFGRENKSQKWVDINERDSSLSNWIILRQFENRKMDIYFKGEYKNGKKVGRWDIFYKNHVANYQLKIGGGVVVDHLINRNRGLRLGVGLNRMIQLIKGCKSSKLVNIIMVIKWVNGWGWIQRIIKVEVQPIMIIENYYHQKQDQLIYFKNFIVNVRGLTVS